MNPLPWVFDVVNGLAQRRTPCWAMVRHKMALGPSLGPVPTCTGVCGGYYRAARLFLITEVHQLGDFFGDWLLAVIT